MSKTDSTKGAEAKASSYQAPPPGDPSLLLQVENVNKSFPGVKALDGMRLDVRPGEVLAVVGENGAGKSTLMKLLTGVYPVESGDFWFDGKPLVVHSPKDAMNQGLAIIHQELQLMPHLTVAENIWIGREPRQLGFFTSRAPLFKATQELLDRLGMIMDPRETVGNLTVAKQQMVEIAKALSFPSTRLLIMDEPTAALNDAEVDALHAQIRRFVTDKTAVVYISHRMNELKRISDRVTVIRDGQFVDTLNMADATIDQVITRMVGREIDTSVGPQNIRDDREVVLRVENLSTKSLLKDINFELQKGEILGFAGLMGAGRTEVARALVGADPIVTGNIYLNGKQVRISSPAAAAKLGIGYLSEDRKRYGLMLEHSVSHNICISSISDQFTSGPFINDGAIKGAATKQREDLRIKTPTVAQLTRNLSGGNQQKAIIGRWLVKNSDVLIFDEPTRGIDIGAKDEIYQLLNMLAEQGKSIIMISSELPEVLRMSHRIVVMSEGRITGVLPASEATQESIMALATHESNVKVTAGE